MGKILRDEFGLSQKHSKKAQENQGPPIQRKMLWLSLDEGRGYTKG
tara:strand:- start:47 stop:184 length:138 start_codon:yes stop_codon:yes gene_type:complete